ncbi:Mariner Mos1 transposase [Eumeta japonica]|uniref:Mariner Mos1 transposase n=1 Tax=Eumeta variegata TaxID=151549 RepID=A0A4C1XTG5_EUMVA|nr:Mariner Mos1 transposase [Eumeta japonica]
MKMEARSRMWWPEINSQIEEKTGSCKICNIFRVTPRGPLAPRPSPAGFGPSSCICIFHGNSFFVTVDAHSKWVECFHMTSIDRNDGYYCKIKQNFQQILCIWWDQLDVTYYELLNPSETITGTLYRTQLMRLSRALKVKRPQYYSIQDKIILLRDNVRRHVAVPVKNYLKTLDCEVLPHPPYSPDTAPSDYHLFRPMAHALSEQRFTSNEDTKN